MVGNISWMPFFPYLGRRYRIISLLACLDARKSLHLVNTQVFLEITQDKSSRWLYLHTLTTNVFPVTPQLFYLLLSPFPSAAFQIHTADRSFCSVMTTLSAPARIPAFNPFAHLEVYSEWMEP